MPHERRLSCMQYVAYVYPSYSSNHRQNWLTPCNAGRTEVISHLRLFLRKYISNSKSTFGYTPAKFCLVMMSRDRVLLLRCLIN